jgi:hypothetical protein
MRLDARAGKVLHCAVQGAEHDKDVDTYLMRSMRAWKMALGVMVTAAVLAAHEARFLRKECLSWRPRRMARLLR